MSINLLEDVNTGENPSTTVHKMLEALVYIAYTNICSHSNPAIQTYLWQNQKPQDEVLEIVFYLPLLC